MSGGFNIFAAANKAHELICPMRRGICLIFMAGGLWFLFKLAGYSRDRQGIFLLGRGWGGILAGYLNYWRHNLPNYQLSVFVQLIQILSEYMHPIVSGKYLSNKNVENGFLKSIRDENKMLDSPSPGWDIIWLHECARSLGRWLPSRPNSIFSLWV